MISETQYYNTDILTLLESDEDCEDPELPFWYFNETDDHLALIVVQYSRQVLEKPKYICDARRLPEFIGCIKRTPVQSPYHQSLFYTLDKIDVYQRDLRPCGSYATKLNSTFVISSWDGDGIPRVIEKLKPDKLCCWRAKIITDYPVSFIYSLPVFGSMTEFKYFLEDEDHEVGYACQPWNYTAYLPYHLRMRNPICEDTI